MTELDINSRGHISLYHRHLCVVVVRSKNRKIIPPEDLRAVLKNGDGSLAAHDDHHDVRTADADVRARHRRRRRTWREGDRRVGHPSDGGGAASAHVEKHGPDEAQLCCVGGGARCGVDFEAVLDDAVVIVEVGIVGYFGCRVGAVGM
jgi:hypothetical protein